MIARIDILLSVICVDDWTIYRIGDFILVSFDRNDQNYVYGKRECTWKNVSAKPNLHRPTIV